MKRTLIIGMICLSFIFGQQPTFFVGREQIEETSIEVSDDYITNELSPKRDDN